MRIADVGEAAGVSQLAVHGLLSAFNIQVTRGQYSALDTLSCKRDIATIKKLFDVGYLGDVNRCSREGAIEHAAEEALSWGHLDVFEELKKHSSKGLNSDRWVCHLLVASASSSLEILKEAFKSASTLLQKPTREVSFQTCQETVEQAVLERAIQFLKPVNIEFLLEKGVRLSHKHRIVCMSWSYSRSHQVAFDATQQILVSYGLPQIAVCV